MELRGRTENNRVVNFVGAHTLIGQFVDVKITEVLPNSLRGEFVRSEQEMDLRKETCPQSILTQNRSDTVDALGVGHITP